MGLIISGIAACETIDSSGEILRIDGLDISSLERDGVFNWEHEAKTASSIVGKILKAKKIFSERDCENDSQMKFWRQVQVPYLWVMGELFDDVGHTEAMNIAAMLRYDMKAKAEGKYTQDMAQLINLSVEGAKLKKEGNVVSRSIARKISITITPCNKVAEAEIHEGTNKKEQKRGKVPELSIFKSETVYLPGAEVVETLEKADQKLSLVKPEAGTASTKSGKPIMAHGLESYARNFSHQDHVDAMNAHWDKSQRTKDNAVKMHHMGMAKKHMKAAGMKEQSAPRGMRKSLELGSSSGAPASLSGGAALAREQLTHKNGRMSKNESRKEKYKGHEIQIHQKNGPASGRIRGAMGDVAISKDRNEVFASPKHAVSHAKKMIDDFDDNFKGAMIKSEIKLLKEAELDKGVETWNKVQHFRQWLADKFPALSKREAEAFTRAFVAYRIKKAEKKLKDI